MKITYLINQAQPDGTVCLSVVTRADWLAVLESNKLLQLDQRRYFIRDCIREHGELDWMIMEAPREMYLAWHRQHKAEEKNRKLGQKYEQVSADASISSPNGSVCLGEILTSGELVEDIVSDELILMELREKLAAWRPWAPELLDIYLDGKRKSCTGFLAKKYGVSEQTVRKYKRQLEEFIKKFFEGVSF